MTNFAYNELFKPFEREGYPLEKVIEWLQKTTGADSQIIDQVVSETMHMISQGEKFEVPEEFKMYPDYTISQFMEARARTILSKIENTKVEILQEMEKTRLEARQKELSASDEELFIMMHGTKFQRFKKWLTTYEGIR